MSKLPINNIDDCKKFIDFMPDCRIGVLQYLPIEQKNDIIQIALQNSEENGMYNLLKLDMYFHLYICYLYTDIEFTDKEKDNPANTYDTLMSYGVIEQVIAAMDPDEYGMLYSTMMETLETRMKYKSTVASVINSFIEQLPVNAENAADIIKNFNPEMFQQVIQFARAANGDRPIE